MSLYEHPYRRTPEISDLIDQIYGAGSDPTGWDDVLSSLDTIAPDTWLVVQMLHRGETVSLTHLDRGWPDDVLKTYANDYVNVSPWVPLHTNATVGVPYNTTDATPTHVIAETPFYQDWARPNRVHCGATAVTFLSEPDRVASLCINYDETRNDQLDPFFGHLLGDIAGHLRNAGQMNAMMAKAMQGAANVRALLDAQAEAVLLVSGAGTILEHNAAAAAVLRAGRGVSVRQGRTLSFMDGRAEARFRQACRLIAAGLVNGRQASDMQVPFRVDAEMGPNIAQLLPAPGLQDSPHWRFFAPSSMGILVKLRYRADRLETSLAALMEAFDMTRAEARLAQALVSGQSLEAFSRASGRSKNTARSQLRSIFEKTSTARQSELVALLTRLLS
ncbi:MAG: hypothetical protein AAF638_13070 [Pseudomonadota bacterium]